MLISMENNQSCWEYIKGNRIVQAGVGLLAVGAGTEVTSFLIGNSPLEVSGWAVAMTGCLIAGRRPSLSSGQYRSPEL